MGEGSRVVALFQFLVLASPSQSLSRAAWLLWAMCAQQKIIPWKAHSGVMVRLEPVLAFGSKSGHGGWNGDILPLAKLNEASQILPTRYAEGMRFCLHPGKSSGHARALGYRILPAMLASRILRPLSRTGGLVDEGGL